jgi:perosamine synthetase
MEPNPQEPIAAFKVKFSDQEVAKYLEHAQKILRSGALIPGTYNQQLESAFTALTGAKHAVALSTGTVTLEVIYRALGLQGKEVLVPSNTNYATAEAVIRADAQPVLYDSDLYPDFESIKQHVTPNTKAVVVVHIGGYITPDIEAIEAFCKEHDLYLIEDASHAHGSRFNDRPAGSFGEASAFSMFATKVVTTGEGGILVTNRQELADQAKVYRDQGKDPEGIRNIVFGSAWRMSELHAALGVVQMENFKDYLDRTHHLAQQYKEQITNVAVHVPFEANAYYSGYKFIVLLDSKERRDSLKAHLVANNIKPGKGVYDVPLHLQPVLSDLNTATYPKAEHFADTHLCLPLWKGLTDDEFKAIVACVNSWQP